MTLSNRQESVLNTVATFKRLYGASPTVAEIARRTLIPHVTVRQVILGLAKEGLLTHQYNKARSLVITPEGESELNKIPIEEPRALHDGVSVVCVHPWADEGGRISYHRIFTDGTCSCKGEYPCFHLRDAAEYLPALIDELESVVPNNDQHEQDIVSYVRRMESWMAAHGLRIKDWSRFPERGKMLTLP